eukprot:GHVO01034320.1.p1 GENE.GHVO01034320.1~~GHVO01034320.1.p1  ORF type:complete len:558 (-),score=91.70 GHVO01034320.1:1139-2773(-)
MNEIVQSISSTKAAWASMDVDDKMVLLDAMLTNLQTCHEDFHETGMRRRGYSDELYGNVAALTYFALAAYMNSVRRSWHKTIGNRGTGWKEVYSNEEAQFLQVGPFDVWTTMSTSCGSIEVEVPIGEGCSKALPCWQKEGGLTVILGAGNFDAPVEIISSMFCDNHVCIYKPSPLLEGTVDTWRFIFAPLIDRGYLHIYMEQSPDEINKLLRHPLVDKWGLTGSAKTALTLLDAPLDENKQSIKSKPHTLELGGCSPYIVMPENMTSSELDAHAKYFVAGNLMNGGHICAHPQILITCNEWKQRSDFLDKVRMHMNAKRPVGSFYKDAADRKLCMKAILEAEGHPPSDFECAGGHVFFQTGCTDDTGFLNTEAFGPYCVEVPIHTSPETFLKTAVDFCNEKCYGTLAITIIAKPAGIVNEKELNSAIANLRYGTVGINGHAMNAFVHSQLVWGGYPGTCTDGDLQSGRGQIGNCLGFPNVTKSILRCPFMGMHLTMQSGDAPGSFNATCHKKTWQRLSAGLCGKGKMGDAWRFAATGSGYLLGL